MILCGSFSLKLSTDRQRSIKNMIIRYDGIFLISILMGRVEVHKFISHSNASAVIKLCKKKLYHHHHNEKAFKHVEMIVPWTETTFGFPRGENKTLLTVVGRSVKLTCHSIVAIVSINYAAFVGLIAFDVSSRFGSFTIALIFVSVLVRFSLLFLSILPLFVRSMIASEKLHFSKTIEFSQKHVSH